MALPPSYTNPEDYLKDAFGFLKTYNWLYINPNIDILVYDIFEQFPSDWFQFFHKLSEEELDSFLLNYNNDNLPVSLGIFLEKIKQLRLNLTKTSNISSYKFPNNSGLSKKKIHEILTLTPLIYEKMTEINCSNIIDIGAGLGYLPQLLYEKYGYSSFGIEANPKFVEKAQTRQFEKYPTSLNNIKYVKHFIDETSQEFFEKILEKSETYLISGLHACADLSITILDLFTKVDNIKGLVIMPCCYHRLKVVKKEANVEIFKNFPISEIMKKLFREFEGETFLKTPFLRLACQGNQQNFKVSKQERRKRAEFLMFRAILQKVAFQEKCQVLRCKRKSKQPRSKPGIDNFCNYLLNLKETHTLKGDLQIDHERFQLRMHEKWLKYKENCYLLEILINFQATIQNICENIVLLDRVEFLKEKGLENCRVERVTDDCISPRCYALIATKL